MEKWTLYLGLNDKDTKVQKIATVEAYKVAMNILSQFVEGATIFEANGMYTHENGTLTIEKTLRIELLFTDEETVKKIVAMLKTVFNQESIAVQKETINSDLW